MTPRITPTALAALAVTALAAPAAAQDWCGASGLNPTEQTICSDPVLGDLDVEMSGLYAALDPKPADQRDWLRARNACGTDIWCIEDAYRNRIALFRGMLAPEPEPLPEPEPPAGLLRPWCGASSLNPTEQTICSEVTLANLDAAMAAVYGAARARDPGQVSWLRDVRDACGADPNCIGNAYVQRLIELGGRLREEGR